MRLPWPPRCLACKPLTTLFFLISEAAHTLTCLALAARASVAAAAAAHPSQPLPSPAPTAPTDAQPNAALTARFQRFVASHPSARIVLGTASQSRRAVMDELAAAHQFEYEVGEKNTPPMAVGP